MAPAGKQLPRSGDTYHEAHLSTQLPQACPYPRISRPLRYAQWTQGPERSSGKGARALGALNALKNASVGERESQRFPRSARLLDSRCYQAIFADSVKSADAYFTVLARTNDLGHDRLGLAISKKCAHRAVDRNRLKRVVRESFRLDQCRLNGSDVVVLCRGQAAKAANQRLFASLAAHWQNVLAKLCVRS